MGLRARGLRGPGDPEVRVEGGLERGGGLWERERERDREDLLGKLESPRSCTLSLRGLALREELGR